MNETDTSNHIVEPAVGKKRPKDQIPHWYAVRVTALHERQLVELLQRTLSYIKTVNGREVVKRPLPVIMEMLDNDQFTYQAYVPIRTEIHQWSDRKKKVDIVLTPGIIFLRTDLKHKNRIYEVSPEHFHFYFSQPGCREPEIIPDTVMNSFIASTRQADEVEIISDAVVGVPGDKVRIIEGSLKGRVYYISSAEPPDKEGYQKVVLELRVLGRILSRLTLTKTRFVKVDEDAVDEIPSDE